MTDRLNFVTIAQTLSEETADGLSEETADNTERLMTKNMTLEGEHHEGWDENTLPLGAVVLMGDGVPAQLHMLSGHATPKEKRGSRYWTRTDSTMVYSPVTNPRLLPLTLLYPQDKETK